MNKDVFEEIENMEVSGKNVGGLFDMLDRKYDRLLVEFNNDIKETGKAAKVKPVTKKSEITITVYTPRDEVDFVRRQYKGKTTKMKPFQDSDEVVEISGRLDVRGFSTFLENVAEKLYERKEIGI